MNTYKLTPTDRRVINKFLLLVADEMEFSTNCIRQPLSFEKLELAFKEVENESKERIEKTRSLIIDFDNGNLPVSLKSYFGDAVTREDVMGYIDQIITQEQGFVESIKKSYMVWVDYHFFGDNKAKELHYSFNPRVTFGYSSQLHEVCRVILTDELRNMFSNSPLCKRYKFKTDRFDFGAFTLDEISCSYYEDTKFFIKEKCIMETVSHEQMYDLDLSNDLLARFLDFEDKKARNEKIIKKLTT